jgi:spore coat protein U-like protein
MKIRHLLLGAAAIALGATALGQDARAGTYPTNMTMSADVLTSCTATAAPINFTTSQIVTGHVNNTGPSGISVTCTDDGQYDVGLLPNSTGSESGGNLVNASCITTCDPIPYTLYQDSGASTAWGNTPGTNTLSTQGCTGTGGGPTGACTGTGSAQGYEAWAKLGVVPPLHAGNYADTVVVTVTFY